MHWLHLCGFSPVCFLIMWTFKEIRWMHEYSHIVHLCGFWPECVFLCICRWPDSVVLYSHWLHRCSFSPVCFLRFEVGKLVAWIVALCAMVRFLPGVNEGVPLQIAVLTEWLVTLWAMVFDLIVDFLVMEKATLSWKCLGAQVTRYFFPHLQF